MRFPPARSVFAVLIVASALLSCSDTLTSIKRPGAAGLRSADVTAATTTPQVVISQIYGGGGNSGATLKNDFVELFNRGAAPVSVAGWSVQYASAAGTSWQVTNLTGTIPAGGYYLVQESAGAGGSQSLPTPDASGGIAMSATAGKVAVVATTKALSGPCPVALAIDLVGFGGSSCDSSAPTLTNTTAATRKNGGCVNTGSPAADFAKTTSAVTPHNTNSAIQSCPALGPLDHLTISRDTTLQVGDSVQLLAQPHDAANQIVYSATISWATSDDEIATVNAGWVRGVGVSPDPASITATATGDGITVSMTQKTTVVAPVNDASGVHWIDASFSSTSFPPGFQAQIFATARNAKGGVVVPSTYRFEAVNPEIATIVAVDTSSALVTGVAAPNDGTKPGFRIIATAKDGLSKPDTFITHSIAIEPALFAPTTIYAKNDEFGDPTRAGADTPNDLLIKRDQYILSYNESRGTPNWVSYELDGRQFGGENRCNCFSADPMLPTDKRIFTSDYTNGGYDRGHMTRSADRTAANGDNATTFYLTNVVPQMADLNQGVWAAFEDSLADSASAGRAVYIITGPLYSKSHSLTFLKNEGKVAIPDSTWKIALIGPRAGGNPFTRANVQGWSDLTSLTIIAVNMPNVAGVRSDPWQKYRTTVDKIETSTGYDFLSLIPEALQDALEANDHAPIAKFAVNGTTSEGATVAFDASASTDADYGRADLGRPEVLDYQWSFSDGITGSGATFTRTFSHYGSIVATLTVTDAFGWPTTVSQTINVQDVAPVVSSLPNAVLITGESYNASGTFSDPGLDSWSAMVDYNDGSAPSAVVLNGKSFTLSHIYHSAGQFRPTITVDDGSLQGAATATVTVQTPLAATQRLASSVQSFASAGAIVSQDAQPLLASLDAAQKQIARGNDQPALNELQAFINKVNAAAMTGRMTTAAATQLTDLASRIQRALTLD